MLDPDIPLKLAELSKVQRRGTADFAILFRYCIELQVSADMLVLADYSPIATLDGQALTEEQRRWLRMYLSATPYAQETALCCLCLN
ncbi:MAG: hypothetical protein IJV82_02585 [Oscillospiraceae bacterium]|nr:hypothetical protein [Oscillospiraceae bacterium]